MENPQTTYTFFHYVGILSPLLFWLGWWIGGQRGEKRGKSALWEYVDAALGRPQQFIYRFAKNGKGPIKIQGALLINNVEPLAKNLVMPIETNLPFIFRFEADKTQWKPGPCCSVHEKHEEHND